MKESPAAIEKMKDRNVIAEKSMAFAIRIVRLCRHLRVREGENAIIQQLLRSGTSIGANVREAHYGQSRSDFVAKMSIALKEAAETEYWLELLYRTEQLTQREYESISREGVELIKLLTAIVRSGKEARD